MPVLLATEGRTLVCEHSVLIVDRSEETREVLKTALERRGMRIYAASRARRGLELARRHHPDVIVLDLDAGDSAPEELWAPFAEPSGGHAARLIVLGGMCHRRRSPAGGEFVSKPYHYAPLVRRIEELLRWTGQVYARSA
jgi:DNA-binding response OmpR family regulator